MRTSRLQITCPEAVRWDGAPMHLSDPIKSYENPEAITCGLGLKHEEVIQRCWQFG